MSRVYLNQLKNLFLSSRVKNPGYFFDFIGIFFHLPGATVKVHELPYSLQRQETTPQFVEPQ